MFVAIDRSESARRLIDGESRRMVGWKRMVEAEQGKCCEFAIISEIYGQPVEFDQKEGDMISLRLPENKFCIAVSELGCASQAQMVAGYRPINGAIVTKA